MADIETPAPPQAEAQPDVVNLVDPDGNLVGIPSAQAHEAVLQGYQPATQAHIDQYIKHQAYGGAGQGVLANVEAAGRAATFGALTPIETGLGITSPEDIAGREEEWPKSTMASTAVGLGASALVPGAGEANILEHLGQQAATKVVPSIGAVYDAQAALRAAKETGVGVEAAQAGLDSTLGSTTLGAKIGSAAVKGAAENAIFQASDEGHRYFSDQSDPNTPAQNAIVDTLGAGLIGGVLGGAGGALSPLWKATVGNKLGGVLGAVTDRLGGSAADEAAEGSAATKLGVVLSPEGQAITSGNPATREMGFKLAQSDTGAGLKLQESLRGDRNAIIDNMAETMGVKPEELSSEWSQAKTGETIGKALQEDTSALLGDTAKGFEERKQTWGKAELPPSIEDRAPELGATQSKLMGDLNKSSRELQKALKTGDVEGAVQHSAKIEEIQSNINSLAKTSQVPGVTDTIAHNINTAALDKGWLRDPDIAPHIKAVLDHVPQMKTVNDLQKEMTRLGDKAAALRKSPTGQGPLAHALESMKQIMRGEEENAIGNAIGSEEGPAAYAEYVKGRAEFARVANIQSTVEDRLKAGGSISGYEKSVGAMVKDDPEGIWRKLNGKGDSALLKHMETYYPKTAEAVKAGHRQQLMADAVKGAKQVSGDKMNPENLMRAIQNMTSKHPELRDFVLPQAIQDRLSVGNTALGMLKDPRYNFSNSGRVVAEGIKDAVGAVTATASGLSGHGIGASLLIGQIGKYLSKDAPDAVRLAMLKFLGSDKPVNAGAFKTAVDFIRSSIKGENAVNSAVKNIFQVGREVIPTRLIAEKRDNDKLDKHIDAFDTTDASMLNDADGGLGHYMPNHAMAVAQTKATVANYVKANRPQSVPMSPLDKKPAPNSMDQAKYQNVLTIANQPLTVMQRIKDGNLTSTDMKHANAMYPQLMQSLRSKLTQEIMSQSAKGNPIPYRLRQSASMFLGQPLDSTMTPQAIIAAQSASQPTPPPQSQGGPPPGRNKHSTASLGKMNAMYQTPTQASEKNALKS